MTEHSNSYLYRHMSLLAKELAEENDGMEIVSLLLNKIKYLRKDAVDRGFKGLALIADDDMFDYEFVHADLVIRMYNGVLRIVKQRD